jgi:hypothetical protein
VAPLPERPDFIDRFYSDVGEILKVTDELSALAQKGIELAKAGKFPEAEAVEKRCLELNAHRLELKAKWESYLKAHGLLRR